MFSFAYKRFSAEAPASFRHLVGLVFWLCLAGSSSVYALQVPGLYSHSVVVANESQGERSRAFSEGLSAVLIKLTGKPEALELAGVARAISNAASFVEGVSYADLGSAGQRQLTVDFSPTLVDELLERQGVPVWNSNRPSVLVWMALQEESGGRRLFDPELDAELFSTLRSFAESRGLPLIFPVLDFEDRRGLSSDQLWDLEVAAIERASERYSPDSILAGRLLITPSGELVGLWRFQFRGEARLIDGLDTELAAYLESPLREVTSQFVETFAASQATLMQQELSLRVDGIRDLADYAALNAYLLQLGAVNALTLSELDADRLELNLNVAGGEQRLRDLIALDRNLRAIDSSATEPGLLHFRWTR